MSVSFSYLSIHGSILAIHPLLHDTKQNTQFYDSTRFLTLLHDVDNGDRFTMPTPHMKHLTSYAVSHHRTRMIVKHERWSHETNSKSPKHNLQLQGSNTPPPGNTVNKKSERYAPPNPGFVQSYITTVRWSGDLPLRQTHVCVLQVGYEVNNLLGIYELLRKVKSLLVIVSEATA